MWLPENYDKRKKYAVLYMNDGQMLFDSSITWNKQEWNVDQTIQVLINENKISECIVVGIWNAGRRRHDEFCPQKPFEMLSEDYKDSVITNGKRQNGNYVFSEGIISDQYLKFVVKDLKPFIDSMFSTKTDSRHTFMAGSSMGGLISLYAICEYPDIFGGAACLSTHWPVIFTAENNPFPDAINEYLKKNLPDPKTHRLYFDYGTETLDTMYKPYQLMIDKTIQSKGYGKKNYRSIEFNGADHSEKSWSKRLHIPVAFLLTK